MNKTNTAAAVFIKQLRSSLMSPAYNRGFAARRAHTLLLSETQDGRCSRAAVPPEETAPRGGSKWGQLT